MLLLFSQQSNSMDFTTLCTVVAALRVVPDRSQFFKYESVSLSCEQQGNSSEWRVKRNTSKYTNQDCSMFWSRLNESHCFNDDLYIFDSGVYWCESAAGECSDTVNILVTCGAVILDSPALPVMEGDAVTLSCRTQWTSSSNNELPADFYKDGLFLRSSSTGNMTIHSVSKSHQGLYRCNVSAAGQSPDGWLAVRAGSPEPPNSPLVHILLPVVGVCLSLVCVMLLCLWRNHEGDIEPSVVLYTDVTSSWEQTGEPLRSHSFLFSSVAVYRLNPVRCKNSPSHVLTYKPETLLLTNRSMHQRNCCFTNEN